MRILVDRGHHETIAILADTPEQCEAVYLKLFQLYDEQEYYTCSDLSTKEQDWYDKAKAADWNAARKLLVYRKQVGAEYENGWFFVEAFDPLVP